MSVIDLRKEFVKLQKEFGKQLDVIYCTNDGTFGVKGFVTAPLQEMYL